MGNFILRLGKRRLLLALAFVVTLLSAVLAPSQETAPVSGKSVRPQSLPVAQAAGALQKDGELPAVVNFERAMDKKITVVDVFEARAVPGVAAAPPPKPVPPKLPFVYQGSVEDMGRIKLVLLEGEQIHVIQKGDLVGAAYRLDDISADSLTFTYLPLGAQQVLPTGDTK